MANLLFFLFVSLSSLHFSASQNEKPENDMCKTLIQPAGYLCTGQTVETKDGFLLTLRRVSSPNNDKISGSPVLLLHGLFATSDACWFSNTPNESAGFIFADQGFDVWAGDFRAGSSTSANVALSPQDKDFWNWSWEDSAWYDLPVMLEHIYSTTKSKIRIITVSQGAMSTLATLTQPKISELVEAAALLSPLAYLDHTTSTLLQTLSSLHYDDILTSTGAAKFDLTSIVSREFAMSVCSINQNCADLLLAPISGKSCCVSSSTIKYYFDTMQPTSVKNIRHYFQSIRSGTFSRFDYGRLGNEKLYGSQSPPEFNLSGIPESVAIWIGYGGKDALLNSIDVHRAIEVLQRKPELLYLEDYGHLDFLWSQTAKEDVFNHIIQFFNSLGN